MEFLLQMIAELFNSQEVEDNIQMKSTGELEFSEVLEVEQNENIFGIMHFH